MIGRWVATAANTDISGSQFILEWNFNFGQGSHDESLIYMNTVLSREQRTHSQPGGTGSQQTLGENTFFLIYLHSGWGEGTESSDFIVHSQQVQFQGLPGVLHVAFLPSGMGVAPSSRLTFLVG